VIESGTERFLAVLDLDPVRAEQKCALLREKLVFYFRKNRVSSPEDLAQEVFLRARSRIGEGQTVYAEHPESYFFGIARNLLREEWKRAARREEELPDELPTPAAEAECTERRMLLEDCLRNLESDNRALLKTYIHEGPERTGVVYGITANAASIRFHRLVARLRGHVGKPRANNESRAHGSAI
jgi:RNA polymerase sigma-70 factor (ECF subfamily)